MGLIVNDTDFIGFYRISDNCYGNLEINAYINRYEPIYLCYLLDDDIRQDFIDDLIDGVPQNPDYLEWFNPFCEHNTDNCRNDIIASNGLKNCLTGFIYYHLVKDQQTQATPTGTTVNLKTNSQPADFLNNERQAEIRYNASIFDFKAIRSKIGYEKSPLEVKLLDII